MKRSPSLLLLALLLLATQVLADKDPLQVTVSVTNGAIFDTSRPGDLAPDSAIRVFIQLTNQTGNRVKVTKMACTFFDAQGRELAQDQAQPLELRGRAQGSAILFFANPSSLYEFKATGVVEYEQDGKIFSVPINVDQTSIDLRRNNSGY